MNDKKRSKRIAALICTGLLVLLYLATLVVAFWDFPGSDRLFAALLVADIGLPILLWIYLWLFKKIRKRQEETAD